MTSRWRAAVICGTGAALTLGLTVAPSSAAETVDFNQTFANPTLAPGSLVFKPTFDSKTNRACLTAGTDVFATPLGKCPDWPSDPAGSGVLVLTPSVNQQVGSVMAQDTLPSTSGLDITFQTHQWKSGSDASADGIGFVLAAVDPVSQTPSTVAGPGGGSLGYSPSDEFTGVDPYLDGYANGYLGVGFDVYGNFLNPQFQGTGCSNPSWLAPSGTQEPNQITVRGPGNGTVGYCALESTANPALGLTQPALRGSTQTNSTVPVNVTINPTSDPTTNAAGQPVGARSYRVTFTGVGQSEQTFTGALPNANGLLPSSWLDANGVPKQMVFGWTASTGGFNDNHAISYARVVAASATAKVRTTQTYVGMPVSSKQTFSVKTTSPKALGTVNNKVNRKGCKANRGDVRGSCGATITYRTKVLNSALTGKIRMVGTLPKSVKAQRITAAKGWKCSTSQAKVTCTSKAKRFTKGQKLKPVVVAVAKR